MSDFQREERYAVFKLRDLAETEKDAVLRLANGINAQSIECVIVESDWPNYEHTWQTIERVSDGSYSDPYAEIERLQSRVAELEITHDGQAASVPEWTDINLRQPDEYQVVLWFCQGGNIRTGMYYGKNHCDRVPETHPISGKGRPHYGKFGRYAEPAESGYIATHWMPLPKPPKQEQGR